jgi:uncharacterized protein with NAD-binding domain and iron-sulfur cluster
MKDRVLILGGGVAGLSAAHELSERGFKVTVCEGTDSLGGKARSIDVPGSGVDGRKPLPGEHGFRFFPGFYRHLPDTMSRIPFGGGSKSVVDNLRATTESMSALEGFICVTPNHVPRSIDDLRMYLAYLRQMGSAMLAKNGAVPSAGDWATMGVRLLQLLCSCERRRFGEWEYMSWMSFTGAERRGPAFQNWLADGITRTTVAARANEMSARTGGYTMLQILSSELGMARSADRVLCGPTSEVWIDPWTELLTSRGVKLLLNQRVLSINGAGGSVSEVVVGNGTRTQTLQADWYICALPVEHARTLLIGVEDTSFDVRSLARLQVRWMNGLQFYLRDDDPLVHGHLITLGTPWALTAISQAQFWDLDLADRGDGSVRGVLSVDVSDWEQHPGITTGRAAKDCSRDEVVFEVLTQLRMALGSRGAALRDENIVRCFVDPDVRFCDVQRDAIGPTDVNLEPLLVNTKGSWDDRPDAETSIPNLFLASDYVRTYTDLATMEGANEAARRAVNGVLERSGSPESRCDIWPLHNPAAFAPARFLDDILFSKQIGSI